MSFGLTKNVDRSLFHRRPLEKSLTLEAPQAYLNYKDPTFWDSIVWYYSMDSLSGALQAPHCQQLACCC